MFLNVLPNYLINGGYHFWQRGTTFASIADSTYYADRWKYKKSGTMVNTIARVASVPTDAVTPYSSYITVGTTSAVASDLCYVQQPVEGSIGFKIYKKYAVLSFWVKSNKTGTYCVRIADSTGNYCLVKEYTISSSVNWEKKILRFKFPTTGGSWGTDTGLGFSVSFILSAGSTYKVATADTWSSSTTAYATSNQVNFNDSTSNYIYFAETVLCEDNSGQGLVPNYIFTGKDYASELRLCQRYYEKSYALETALATNTVVGMAWINSATTSNIHFYMPYAVEKRVSPLVWTWDRAGNASKLTNTSNTTYTDNITNSPGVVLPSNMSGPKGLSWSVAPQTAPTNNTGFHWAVDSEL